MARTDEDREFRLRPTKPRVVRNEGAAWSNGFKLLMHYARSSRKTSNRGAGGKGKGTRPYHQRCAVRATYLKNKIRGQWKAHGRYLARESATFENDAKAVGFDRGSDVDIARRLESWQTAGDAQMWKLIVSPEFGDRVDLSRLTRGLIERMKKDLGTSLEWVAVEHNNTEHPHVHVVVRGVRDNGEVLRMSREYVQRGIRGIAEDLCTRQLGYRTEIDAADAERREISEKRFTSLDRRLLNEIDSHDPGSDPESKHFTIVRDHMAGLNETARLQRQHEIARLAVLRQMGLAEPIGANAWRLRRDSEQILRAMQKAVDRQRTLAAHGVLMSDERLPIEVLDTRQFTSVEGRVLVHGQDEQHGRNYLMLEGTDAKVHFINYTQEIEEARSRGELRINSFVRLRKLQGMRMDLDDLGDAEKLLSNRHYLSQAAREHLKRGILVAEDGWGGWLGRYQTALAGAEIEIAQRREFNQQQIVERRPRKGRSFDR
jgi:type IV secretory pathway VirD2 relaxase